VTKVDSKKQIINIEYQRMNSHKVKIEMNNIGCTEKENIEDFFTNDINFENQSNKNFSQINYNSNFICFEIIYYSKLYDYI
jgi:hypothetical protein